LFAYADLDVTVGIEDIAMIPGSSIGNTKNYFKPKALEGMTPAEVWQWWQRRRQSEGVLKSAIASNVVS
jgi:hypothetical protein